MGVSGISTKRETSRKAANLFISVSLLWATTATVVLLVMLLGRDLLAAAGFPVPIEHTFTVFGITTVAFFVFIPPIFLSTSEDEEPASSVWHIVGLFFLLALATAPFLLLVRRFAYVDKLHLSAALALAAVCGLSSAFFYVLFPRWHYFFFSAIAFGFPFVHILLLDIWGMNTRFISGFSPFVSIYFMSPGTALQRFGFNWGNTLVIFGLIAVACLVYIVLWGGRGKDEGPSVRASNG